MNDEEINSKLEKGNELIANTMAQRMLAQVRSGKSSQSLHDEKEKMKGALNLAQKAYYDKDPEAIALL